MKKGKVRAVLSDSRILKHESNFAGGMRVSDLHEAVELDLPEGSGLLWLVDAILTLAWWKSWVIGRQSWVFWFLIHLPDFWLHISFNQVTSGDWSDEDLERLSKAMEELGAPGSRSAPDVRRWRFRGSKIVGRIGPEATRHFGPRAKPQTSDWVSKQLRDEVEATSSLGNVSKR